MTDPALAGEYVEDGLRAYDLGHGRDQRRIARLGSTRDLGQDLVHAIGRLLDLKLAHEVGHHATGNLMAVDAHVRERRGCRA